MMNISPLPAEPWVHLLKATDFEWLRWDKTAEIAHNQQLRQSLKYLFYQLAFDYVSESGVHGDYLEFGCHRARTFRMALTEARRHNLDAMLFYAFDSFQGLPEPQQATDKWTQGALTTTLDEFDEMITQHGLHRDRVCLIPGFYRDSLNLARRETFVRSGCQAAMVTIDCDLYESAVPVFSFLDPLLQEGTVVYIDDWFAGYKGNPAKGVQAAFREYESVTHWKFIPHMTCGWWGRSFIVTP